MSLPSQIYILSIGMEEVVSDDQLKEKEPSVGQPDTLQNIQDVIMDDEESKQELDSFPDLFGGDMGDDQSDEVKQEFVKNDQPIIQSAVEVSCKYYLTNIHAFYIETN